MNLVDRFTRQLGENNSPALRQVYWQKNWTVSWRRELALKGPMYC